jgi:hypothetical protein
VPISGLNLADYEHVGESSRLILNRPGTDRAGPDFAGALSARGTRVAAVVVTLVIGIFLLLRTRQAPVVQWDFEVSYYSAIAHQAGMNPYDSTQLAAVAGKKELPFTYPPYVLDLIRPFTWMPLAAGAQIYLGIKILMLLAIFPMWRAIFGFPDKLALAVFAIFAFNSTIFHDLFTGNISSFEQFFIWLGMYWYWREKPALAAMSLVAGSCMKLVPGALLVVLLLDGRKEYVKWFAIGCATFLMIQAGAIVRSPELYWGFVHNAGGLDERGPMNPASLAFFRSAFDTVCYLTKRQVPYFAPFVVYEIFTVGVLLMARRVAKINAGDPEKVRQNICLVVLTYAVLIPRFKDYSYILVIAPALFAILSIPWWRMQVLLVVLAMLPVFRYQGHLGGVLDPMIVLSDDYYLYGVLLAIWWMYCAGRRETIGRLSWAAVT